jgi:hypothetical protein
MTLETAAVAFLRAHVAWSKAKRATHKLRCDHRVETNWGPLGCIDNEPDAANRCANCRKREPLMDERRAALKTYNQARRRALRALQKET